MLGFEVDSINSVQFSNHTGKMLTPDIEPKVVEERPPTHQKLQYNSKSHLPLFCVRVVVLWPSVANVSGESKQSMLPSLLFRSVCNCVKLLLVMAQICNKHVFKVQKKCIPVLTTVLCSLEFALIVTRHWWVLYLTQHCPVSVVA